MARGRTAHGGLAPALAAAGLVLALAWAWREPAAAMVRRWSVDPRYNHGFLVPLFAAWLLRGRLAALGGAAGRASWWALGPIALAAAGRLLGSHYYLGWVEMASILPALAGLALLLGGRPALRAAWPAIAFLIFMIPLPYRAEVALGAPLQGFATASSLYALQTCGTSATAEGNVIVLDDARINVVEACNGMGMMFMFLAFAVAIALVSRRPLVDRLLLVAAGVPVALAANVARIAGAGLLHGLAGGPAADSAYHDLAGWLMMPAALLMFGLASKALGLLFVEVDEGRRGPGPSIAAADAGPAPWSPPGRRRRVAGRPGLIGEEAS